jgi:HSP20 family protein
MAFLKKRTDNRQREGTKPQHARGDERGLMRRPREGEAPTGLQSLREEMDRAFERVLRGFGGLPVMGGRGTPELLLDWPALDVEEDEKNLTVRADVPGLKPEDIDIELSGNQLTIRGQRADERTEEQCGSRFTERRFGSFMRTIPLPDYIDRDQVDARYDRGILTLTIPKVAGKGLKRVQVRP